MKIIESLRLRADRGFTLSSIGPNEARTLFDATAASVASSIALVFCGLFITPIKTNTVALCALLPLMLVGFSALLGLYSRLRLAMARVKAAALCGAVALTCLVANIFFHQRAVIVLWAVIVSGPIVLSRLLLSLHADRHRTLASVVDNRGGPVLVLGGAGYIGAHTIDLLLKSGREVRVLDGLMYGDASLADFRDSSRFSFIKGDITEISKLTLAMKDCSAVIHLAGLVGDPACAVDPEFTRHENIISTRMAREVAEAMGVPRFIFASSCSVYGVSDKDVTETDPLKPVSLYAQTKIDSERELLATIPDNFFVTILRFATVFGHSRRPRFDLVANLFTAQAMMDGLITVIGPDQWRPFVHVRDLARAILATLQARPEVVQSQIFNVGDSSLNMTILQLAQRVQSVAAAYRQVDIAITDNPQDRRNYAVSFEKIRRILGFTAETTVEAGVREMIEQFKIGHYQNYRSPEYSNLAMTAKALNAFQDSAHLARMYAPLR